MSLTEKGKNTLNQILKDAKREFEFDSEFLKLIYNFIKNSHSPLQRRLAWRALKNKAVTATRIRFAKAVEKVYKICENLLD